MELITVILCMKCRDTENCIITHLNKLIDVIEFLEFSILFSNK